MTVIYILIIISVIIAVGFLSAFIWGLKSGQWDDTYTPGVRILFDEDQSKNKSMKETEAEATPENMT